MLNSIKEFKEKIKNKRKERRLIKYIKRGEKVYGKLIWGKTLNEMEKNLKEFADTLDKQLEELNY